jgi:hypothetical protein
MPRMPDYAQLQWLALAGVGIYFGVQSVAAAARYWRFRRCAAEPLATWRTGRPHYLPFYWALGLVSGILAVFDGLANGKWVQLFSQASIALYFLVVTPMTLRVQAGLYEAGIWSAGRYVQYSQVGRWAIVEKPSIALLLLPKSSSRAIRLAIPPDDYGLVMKIFAKKLHLATKAQQEGILNLE